MKQTTFEPFIIFSAERGFCTTQENKLNSMSVLKFLQENGFEHMTGSGVYKGVKEMSFLALIHNDSDREEILELAKLYNQDCVLYCDEYRNASTIDVSNTHGNTNLGKFKEVTKAFAESQDYYSLFDGRFYVA